MAGITHRIPQPVLIARAREAVPSHVDESAPAIVDLDAGELREDSRETVDENGAALCVGALIRCRREARPSAEYQTVVGCQAKIVADIHRRDAGAIAGHGGRDFGRVQRTGRYNEAADGDEASPKVTEIGRSIGARR